MLKIGECNFSVLKIPERVKKSYKMTKALSKNNMALKVRTEFRRSSAHLMTDRIYIKLLCMN